MQIHRIPRKTKLAIASDIFIAMPPNDNRLLSLYRVKVRSKSSRFTAVTPPPIAATDGCSHRPPCSACPRFGVPGIASTSREKLQALAQLHGVPSLASVVGNTVGFRLRSRLAIRGRLGQPKIGLFEEGTHRVVHIPNCVVHHPMINRVASVVRRALVECRITCYSDSAHLGLARYLQVVIERQSQTAQVTLVANASSVDPLAECMELIAERLGSDLHSLWFNANTDLGNTILGLQFHLWRGPPTVVERFDGTPIHYPPGAFGQSNLDLAESMIEQVRKLVPPHSVVAEFYGGVGAIGLSLLPQLSALRINEISLHSLHGLELGLADLDATARAKVLIFPGFAGAALAAAAGAQIVIADPPRKGLDSALTQYLCENPPYRFIYISCGLESLLADTVRLTANGTLRLAQLTAFDLLPFTSHVETLAVFERI